MKKQTKIILVAVLIVAGYILSRPYIHISDGVLFYRDSVSERFNSVTLWK